MDIGNTEVNKFLNKWGRHLRHIIEDVKYDDETDEGPLNQQDVDILVNELKLRIMLQEQLITKKQFLNETILNHVRFDDDLNSL